MLLLVLALELFISFEDLGVNRLGLKHKCLRAYRDWTIRALIPLQAVSMTVFSDVLVLSVVLHGYTAWQQSLF
jgi:uncharacterized membrane protein